MVFLTQSHKNDITKQFYRLLTRALFRLHSLHTYAKKEKERLIRETVKRFGVTECSSEFRWVGLTGGQKGEKNGLASPITGCNAAYDQ